MIILGDSLLELPKLPENSVDAIVTDPPYGLSFMGKKWDYDVPSVELWREVLRVLKPGGHLLSFGGTRTYHRMVAAIEDAGFEVRDQIQWIYGSGFPKSLNLKDEWQGWGTALKPANEPIVLARKPISEKTVAKNVERWGVGAINVDGGRIAHNEPEVLTNRTAPKSSGEKMGLFKENGKLASPSPSGRWPANVLFDEEAAQMLDEQSGISSGSGKRTTKKQNSMGYHEGDRPYDDFSYPDSGGASRFFYVAKASKRERNAGCEGMPERVRNITEGHGRGAINTSKAGDGIRVNKPCANVHPTVKPIKLMEYLCKLITPRGGTILDPFMGSGSTGVAAKNLGFEFVGIEMNAEYLEIARRRIGA